jgi:hypothetical protein
MPILPPSLCPLPLQGGHAELGSQQVAANLLGLAAHSGSHPVSYCFHSAAVKFRQQERGGQPEEAEPEAEPGAEAEQPEAGAAGDYGNAADDPIAADTTLTGDTELMSSGTPLKCADGRYAIACQVSLRAAVRLCRGLLSLFPLPTSLVSLSSLPPPPPPPPSSLSPSSALGLQLPRRQSSASQPLRVHICLQA